jgi:hypothetical protein
MSYILSDTIGFWVNLLISTTPEQIVLAKLLLRLEEATRRSREKMLKMTRPMATWFLTGASSHLKEAISMFRGLGLL